MKSSLRQTPAANPARNVARRLRPNEGQAEEAPVQAPAPAAPTASEPAHNAAPAPARSAAVAPAVTNPAPAPSPSIDELQGLLGMDASDFASAMNAALAGGRRSAGHQAGDAVEGVIARVGTNDVFIDLGTKSEATMSRAELTDASGQLTVAVGDRISGFVLEVVDGEVRVGRRLSGANARRNLEAAAASGVPLEGRVTERNTGGFNVDIAGQRAFCPTSQIDQHPGDDLDSFVGRTMLFRVLEGGRDLVVSARAVQEDASRARAAELWTRLAPGQELDGVVASVQEFGAFVDLGGVQGLVHKSELGWGEDVQAPPKGQAVKVRVLEVDPAKKRISLSMKDPNGSGWNRLGTDFMVGLDYPGRVSRLADFGAFVELAPGLVGLVHVSQISSSRIGHPSDALKVGQTVTARIVEADPERKRLSLSIKQAGAAAGGDDAPVRPPPSRKGGLGTMADLFAAAKKK